MPMMCHGGEWIFVAVIVIGCYRLLDFGGKKFKIEIDSLILAGRNSNRNRLQFWREEIQNRNRLLDFGGKKSAISTRQFWREEPIHYAHAHKINADDHEHERPTGFYYDHGND